MCVAVGWIVTVRARCLIACTWMARVGAALGWEGGSSTGREKFRRRRNFCDRGEGRGQGGPKGDHPGCFMMSRQCQKHHKVAGGCSAQAFGPGVFGPIGPSECKCHVALHTRQRGPGGWRGFFFLSVAPSNRTRLTPLRSWSKVLCLRCRLPTVGYCRPFCSGGGRQPLS